MSLFMDDISLLREHLIQKLASGIDPIEQMVLQPIQGEGKMLRPRLVLMANCLFAPPSEPTLDVALAVECIHTASLIHDDIIDQSYLRRGQPSTVSLYGPQAAVLIGDHYFATAFRLLASHGLCSILHDLAGVVSDMCTGEIRQDLDLYNPYLSEDDYFSNVFGKTASLFAGACRAGAMTAGAPEESIQALGQIGLHLGNAYQLTDDVLDFTADEAELGKPTGSDLKNGIITLPVIRALTVSPEREWLARTITSKKISNDDVARASAIITRCGALNYTRAVINEHLNQAHRLLHGFAPSPARERFMTFGSNLTGGYIFDSIQSNLASEAGRG
ncbi:MAG: polyprenyl synthetase family protein [Methylocystaceae bacterium]